MKRIRELPSPRCVRSLAQSLCYEDSREARFVAADRYEQIYNKLCSEKHILPTISSLSHRILPEVRYVEFRDGNSVAMDNVSSQQIQSFIDNSECKAKDCIVQALVDACWHKCAVIYVRNSSMRQAIDLAGYRARFANCLEKIVIVVESGADVEIIDSLPSTNGQRICAYELFVHKDARVNMTITDCKSLSHAAVISLQTYLEERSAFVLHGIVGKAKYTYVRTRTHLNGNGALAHVNVTPIVCNDSYVQMVHEQCHFASLTTSRVNVRGVGLDEAQLKCYSSGFVAPNVTGVHVDQQSKILAMDPAVSVSAYPCLSVNSRDVHCSHGAAVGNVLPEHFWYAASRGLDKRSMRTVFLNGFIATCMHGENAQINEYARIRCEELDCKK